MVGDRPFGSCVVRDAALICAGLAATALLVWPREVRAAAGVVGGGVLMALSAWAIRGVVDALMGEPAGGRPVAWLLVKFFTRHAMLALAAYGMMVRLHLDPVGMLVGVSAPVIAAGVEVIRRIQRVS